MYIQQAIDILMNHYQQLSDKNVSPWYSDTQLQWALETAITVMNEKMEKEG